MTDPSTEPTPPEAGEDGTPGEGGGDPESTAADHAEPDELEPDELEADELEADELDADERPWGDFRVAVVAGISVELPNQHPTVVLRETEAPGRQLSFSMGMQDAVALSHAVRRIPTPRPLAAELLSGVLQAFDIDIVAVRLVGRQGPVYFAELDLRGKTGRSILACRPSDALTVAELQPVPVPILIDQRLIEEPGDVAPLGTAGLMG